MRYAFIAIVSLAYLVLAHVRLVSSLRFARAANDDPKPTKILNKRLGNNTVVYAVMLMEAALIVAMLAASPRLGLPLVAAIVALCMLIVSLFLRMAQVSRALYLVLVILNALAVLLLVLPSAANAPLLSLGNVPHAVLALIAYSISGVLALQTALLLFQQYALANKRYWQLLTIFPPLEVSEAIFHRAIVLTFAWLTIALASGFWLLEDWLAQHVAHKTVFSILAWLIFLGLVAGRRLKVWPTRANKYWAGSAVLLLAVGFVGSKWVLQYVLV